MAGFPFSSLSITSEVIIQARQEPEELVRFVGRGFLHRRQMPMLGLPNLVRRMTAEIAAQMSIDEALRCGDRSRAMDPQGQKKPKIAGQQGDFTGLMFLRYLPRPPALPRSPDALPVGPSARDAVGGGTIDQAEH